MATATVQASTTQRAMPLRAVSIGCALFVAVFAAIALKTILLTGHWYYPLDDTYIDMSIAKHLALYGVWGTSSQFASAASCPGYVVLLAVCYRIFGVSQYTPLLLTFLASVGTIFATSRILRRSPFRLQVIGIVLVTALTPLWTMSALGMEHALQVLLCLLFVDLATPAIASGERMNWAVLLVAALMVSVRYEGLFVAAGACLVLLFQKRLRVMLSVCAAAWLPVAAFGLYFRMHGAQWFPNSLLLKGGASVDRITGFMERGFYLAPLMLLISWLAWRNRRVNSPAKAAVCITAVAMWLHFCFADYGRCYRYEAYLIALGIVSLVLCYREGLLAHLTPLAVPVTVGILVAHAWVATVTVPGRSSAIYMQQVQTAKLLRLYPAPMAINDIGAPTFFTNTPVLDLVGLGSQDVFYARYHRPYTTAAMQGLLNAHKIQTIAVYDSWFGQHPADRMGGPPLPAGYIRVARLDTPDPAGYVGSGTVSYYAVRGSEAKLRAALRELQPTLPAGDMLSFK